MATAHLRGTQRVMYSYLDIKWKYIPWTALTSTDSAGKAETSKNGRSICPNSWSSVLPFSSLSLAFSLSLNRGNCLRELRHRPHSISQFLSVQMIFFSPLANIDFLSFVSLELYSPRLRSLSLCCWRSSITARKTLDNNVSYLPAAFEPAEKTQKHKSRQKEDALVVNTFLKPSSSAMPAAKLDSGQAAAEQRPLPNAAAGSITSVCWSRVCLCLIHPSLINSAR